MYMLFPQTGNYYIFMEVSNVARGQFVSLVSPDVSGAGCASFYRHMRGQHIGSLTVSERINRVDTVLATYTEDDIGK